MTVVIPAWFAWLLAVYVAVHIGLTLKQITLSSEQVRLQQIEMRVALERNDIERQKPRPRS